MQSRAELTGVLDAARAGGARAAEVIRVEREWMEQTGSRLRGTEGEECVWCVRVYRDGGATGTGEHASAAAAIKAALTMAASAPADEFAGPAERMTVAAGALGVDDRRHTGISDGDRAEVLQFAERTFAPSGLLFQRLIYRQVREQRAWMSTRGMEAEAAATTYALTAEVRAGGWDLRQTIASRHFSDVASLPFGTELRKRADGLSRSGSLPDAAWPIVLEPRVVADLIRALAPAFAADQAGACFLKDYLGKRLSTPAIHLTDDAGLTSGLLTRAFDDRGVPPIPVTLLKEGVVTGLYHDPESARKVGLRPTGHVTEGKIRPSNLVVRPGGRTRNVILTELKSHLLLDRLPPFDLASGRFTGRVPVVIVRAGEPSVCASGHLDVHVGALLAAVVELAADQERSGEVDAPTAVLEGLALT